MTDTLSCREILGALARMIDSCGGSEIQCALIPLFKVSGKLLMAPKTATQTGRMPAELVGFLSDVALWRDETPEDFRKVFDAIEAAVQPKDGLDWIWTKGIAELAFEIRRYRKMKRLFTTYSDSASETRGMQFRNKYKFGKSKGVSLDEYIEYHSILSALPELEIIEKLLASAETRMVAFVREIGVRNVAHAQKYEEAMISTIEDRSV